MSAPKFIEIHGLGAPAEPKALPQTFGAPYAGRAARLYEFILPASASALQRVCDTMFNGPTGGAFKYEPLMPLVFISLIDAVKLNAVDPVVSQIGWFRESDTVFWFLALATDPSGVRSVCGVPLYCFVDQPQALLTGREVHAWPKELSTLTLTGADSDFSSLAVSTIGMRAFGPDVQAGPIDILRISQVPGSAGVTPANLLGSFDDVLRVIWDVSGAALSLLRHGAVSDLLAEIRGGAVPLSFLKQFRDAVDGSTACYQAIVSVPMRASAIRRGGLLPGTFTVELPDNASHPIASDLGLDPAALTSIKGLWLDFDFVIERGTEVWRAQ